MTCPEVAVNLPSTTLQGEKRQKQGVADLDLVHITDLVLGALLGRGCFADVHEVLHFKPLPQQAPHSKCGESKYAIKCLRTDFKSRKTFPRAARDLQTEVDLLSEIAHPHIINIYAKSASDTDPSSCTQDNARDFFIVMDRLSGSLMQRICYWSQEQVQVKAACTMPSLCRPYTTRTRHKPQLDPFSERLKVGHDVASALTYLHEHSIVYRDLKADNVGFDMDGDNVKLFDFGLARRLPTIREAEQVDDERCYRMTKMVGSLPHMAPEVWKGEPYNEKADVYSFAILLWAIMTLEMPHIDLALDLQLLTKRVMLEGHRPTVPSHWPQALQSLMSKAWHDDMKERPSRQVVCNVVGGMVPRSRPKVAVERRSS